MDIVCFDLDGTLISAREEMHPMDVEILRKASQENDLHTIIFIPCTGRSIHAVKRLFTRYALFNERPIPYPLVVQNGSMTYKPGEVLNSFHPFQVDIQEKIINTMANYPQVAYFYFGEERVFLANPTPYGITKGKSFDLPMEPFDFAANDLPFSKAMMACEDKKPLQELASIFQDWPIEKSFSYPTLLEVNPIGIDKGTGLQELLSSMHLENVTIYAAGDGENDLPLFSLARQSFAPSTSPQAIKDQATKVIDLASHGLLYVILQSII